MSSHIHPDPGPSTSRPSSPLDVAQSIDTASEFFRILTASYEPPTDLPPLHRAQPRPDHAERCRATINWTPTVSAETTSSPLAQPPPRLDQPMYQPHGRWAWTHGLPIDDPKQLLSLRSRHPFAMFARDAHSLTEGAQCSASIDSGSVAGTEIKYICRK